MIKYLLGPQTFFRSVLKFRVQIKMEIICAGYPKTGSKTCSAALKVLRDNFSLYLSKIIDFGL